MTQQTYGMLARFGFQYHCSRALLDLRLKLCASGTPLLVGLSERCNYDILDHSHVMAERLMSERDFKYYVSWSK